MGKVGDFFVTISAKLLGFDTESKSAEQSLRGMADASRDAEKAVKDVGESAAKTGQDLEDASNSANRAAQSFEKIGKSGVRVIGPSRKVVSDLNKELEGTEANAFAAFEEMKRGVRTSRLSFKGFGTAVDGVLTKSLNLVGKLAGALSVLAVPASLIIGFAKLVSAMGNALIKVGELRDETTGLYNTWSDKNRTIQEQFEDISSSVRTVYDLENDLEEAVLDVEAATQKQLEANKGIIPWISRGIGLGRTNNEILEESNAIIESMRDGFKETVEQIREAKRELSSTQGPAEGIAELKATMEEWSKTQSAVFSLKDQVEEGAKELARDSLSEIDRLVSDSNDQIKELRDSLAGIDLGPEGEKLLSDRIRQIQVKRQREAVKLYAEEIEERKKLRAEDLKDQIDSIQMVIDKERELQDLRDRQTGQFGAVRVGAGGLTVNQDLIQLTYGGMRAQP